MQKLIQVKKMILHSARVVVENLYFTGINFHTITVTGIKSPTQSTDLVNLA